MSQLSLLRMLPLLALWNLLFVSLGAAIDATQGSILPITLGEKYTGQLTPSVDNPQGEVCYKLAVKANQPSVLNVKTNGTGNLKFAVYDRAKALQFFHNSVNEQPPAAGRTDPSTGFNFPATANAAQLCLSTTNPGAGQQYNFMVTAKPGGKVKPRIVRRPRPEGSPSAAPKVEIPPAPTIATGLLPILPVPSSPPSIEIVPLPKVKLATLPAPDYCYVGTWQVIDLSQYWQPMIQHFTQAKIADPQTIGYGKVILTQDGKSLFESFDFEQKYTLKSPQTDAPIDKVGLSLAGKATAKFQDNRDRSLTFSSQNYRRMSSKLNLGDGLSLNSDRLFTIFGDRDKPPAKLPYECTNRDRLMLRIPMPTGNKFIPIAFKRVN